MTLVPAVMALLGERAWWLPRWLDKALPTFDVEGEVLTEKLKLARWPGGDHLLYADLAKAENIPYYANGWSQILGKDTLKSDQIHPNAAGYDTFARGLAAYLKESGWLR